jgi:hypothetical protein
MPHLLIQENTLNVLMEHPAGSYSARKECTEIFVETFYVCIANSLFHNQNQKTLRYRNIGNGVNGELSLFSKK